MLLTIKKLTLVWHVAANTVVVIVLDKQDPDGVDHEAPVWDDLAALPTCQNIWLCPVYDDNNAMYFNGNDALVLAENF